MKSSLCRSLIVSFVALCASAAPMVASAETVDKDRAYCEKLRDVYERYIGHSATSARKNTGQASGQVAAAQCQSDTANSITKLEASLRGNGFALPARD